MQEVVKGSYNILSKEVDTLLCATRIPSDRTTSGGRRSGKCQPVEAFRELAGFVVLELKSARGIRNHGRTRAKGDAQIRRSLNSVQLIRHAETFQLDAAISEQRD